MEKIPMFYDVATQEELEELFLSPGDKEDEEYFDPNFSEEKEAAKRCSDYNLERLASIYSIRGDEEKAAYYIHKVSDVNIINNFYHYM